MKNSIVSRPSEMVRCPVCKELIRPAAIETHRLAAHTVQGQVATRYWETPNAN